MSDLAAAAALLPAGKVRAVVTAPEAVLAMPCPQVDPCDPAVVELSADLIATMRVSPGCVGLAANQVGVAAHVFCLNVAEHPKTVTSHGEFVLVNGVIASASRNSRAREGCMSVPDFTGDVKRAGRLQVTGQLPGTGETVSFATDAFEARAVQHELDHLDGLLFLDRVAGAHHVYPRKTYL